MKSVLILCGLLASCGGETTSANNVTPNNQATNNANNANNTANAEPGTNADPGTNNITTNNVSNTTNNPTNNNNTNGTNNDPDPPVTFAGSDGLREVDDFGENPGNLGMFEYIPDQMPEGSPLVVVIHGCSQNADNIDDEPGWTELADEHLFALAFPESDRLGGCFAVESPSDHTRGEGDVASIAEMVAWMEQQYSLDQSRTFVTGFSSGGEMTNIALAAYPDVFEAGASQAGFPYRCATNAIQLNSCAAFGRDLEPDEWADLVYEANPGDWTWPRMLVLHGTSDLIVSFNNFDEQMEQWTALHEVDQTADVEGELGGYPHLIYQDDAGNSLVETVEFTGMGHRNPVFPGDGPDNCGSESLTALTQDVGVCVAAYSLKFFGIIP